MKNLLLLISVFIFSCKNKNNEDWEKIKIDSQIKANRIYRLMNTENEILNGTERNLEGLNLKRTSAVTILDLSETRREIYSGNDYNCRAYLNKDSLQIQIGFSSGFSGNGFGINIVNGKFYAEPYSWTDAIDPRIKEPTYKMVSQELILDKSKYSIGDSLFGKIYFHTVENNKEKLTDCYGEGYFRAKIHYN